MGLWKAFISLPVIWIAETVGVLESLEIGAPFSTFGYIGMAVGLFFVGLFSDD